MSNRIEYFSIVLLLAFFVSGCEREAEKIELVINGKTLYIEVARTGDELQKGLMFRKSMPFNEGMIFLFPEYKKGAFWMKNTEIPLSIAFIRRDGEVIDIFDMKPFSESSVQPRLSYMYALELNKGAFERLGVKVGDIITLPESIGNK